MTRKNILIIVSVLFLIVVIGIVGGYFYLSNTRATLELIDNEGIEGDLGAEGIMDLSTTTPNIGSAANPLEGEVPRLRKISATPISGAVIFDRRVGSTTVSFIRFVDRATGNVYETATSSLNTVRITNTTIPKVNEAMFNGDGSAVVLRYSNDTDLIQTFVGKILPTSSELNGSFLPENVLSPVLSPSKNRFFYFLPNSNPSVNGGMGSIGYTSDFAPKSTNVFSHPLKGWNVNWSNENILVFTNKPTSVAQSSSYTYSLTGKSLTKIIGPKNGLVVLPSHSVQSLIYSETINNTLLSGFKKVSDNFESTLSRPTIPDKCVWATGDGAIFCGTPKYVPLGQYPDFWYQGLVSFNDLLTLTDPLSLQTTEIVDPLEVVGEEIDATDLNLSADGKYLIFTNKKDLSLWGLRI